MTAGFRRSMLGWVERRYVLTLVTAAALLRLTSLGFQSFWLDEAHTVFYAHGQTASIVLTRLLKPGENGPLYYLLVGPWIEVFGGSEAAVRAFSVAASLPAIPLCYGVLQRLVDLRVARLGTALFSLAPYETWYAQEAKMYALLVTLALLALFLFLRADHLSGQQRTRGWRAVRGWTAYAAAALACIYVHFFGFFAMASHGALALWLHRADLRALRGEDRSGAWRRIAPPLVTVGLVLAVVALRQLAAVRRDVVGTAQLGGFTLAQEFGTLLYAFTLNVAPFPLAPVLFVTILLLLAGSLVGTLLGRPGSRENGDGRRVLGEQISTFGDRPPDAGSQRNGVGGASTVPLALLFWTPLVGYIALSALLRSALFADRYFIVITPAFYALLAAGLLWLYDRARWLGLATAALVAAGWLYGTAYPKVVLVKDDFRSATALFNRDAREGDVVVALPAPMAFAIGYYSAQPPTFAYADVGPPGQPPPPPEELLANQRRVWVMGKVPESDRLAGRLLEWLRRNGSLEEQRDFAGDVRLLRYGLRATSER